MELYEMYYTAKQMPNGLLKLVKKKIPIHFNLEVTQEFLNMLLKDGYNCIQIDEGTLGLGTWYCLPPEKKGCIYIIEEVYENPWSSAQTIMRKRRLTKTEKAIVNKAM